MLTLCFSFRAGFHSAVKKIPTLQISFVFALLSYLKVSDNLRNCITKS